MREPGSTFGRYVLEVLLGEGGMGSVYRAQDTLLHRRVALKLLRGTQSESVPREEGSARMLREARAAAAFEHPNAVSIYDVGEIDATPYIAMELVTGRCLRDYVGDTTLAWDLKLRWLLEIASALAAAHEAGMVHRDVKPHNVIVRDDGHVKVLDFGIARRMTTALSEADAARLRDDLPTITTEGMVLGTPQYMPPEQLAGAPLDGRADQFGWGVTAYELLSGQRPWPVQTSVVATITAILSVPPAPLLALLPSLPPAVDAAIHRALAKLPEERFETMHELIAAIEPFAAVPAAHTSGPPGATSAPLAAGLLVEQEVPGPVGGLRRGPAGRGDAAARGVRGSSGPVALAGMGARGPRRRGARHRGGGRRRGPSVLLAPLRRRVGARGLGGRRPAAKGALGARRAASSSPVAAAVVAYRRGLQAQHDANDLAAESAYRSAFQQDPGLGAAQLRYAILTMWDSVVEARQHFALAQQLRASLGPHDQRLLEGMTPLFTESPPNWSAAERRFRELTAAEPGDAELALMLAWVSWAQGHVDEAVAAQNAALALDPSYAAALESRIETRQIQGDFGAVIEGTEACLRIAPAATSCLRTRVWAYNELGRCVDFDQDIHRILAIDPENSEAYEGLAEASLALGKPPEVAWEALRAGWKHETPEDLPLARVSDRAWMAVATGDPKGLDAAMSEWHGLVAERDDVWSHYQEASARVRELQELGQLDRAARVADEYLRARDGWVPDPGIDNWTAASDGVPPMLEALARAGAITREEQARRRAAWIDGWKARMAPRDVPYLWIFAYADVVTTAAEAEEAIAAQPAFGPIPKVHPMHESEAEIGHMYLLAGRLDDALASLERMARWCRVSEDPFVWVRAGLWLGEAREAKGDRDGACAAYAGVTGRWAGFGARSVTVREARKNMKALGCGG